MSNLIRPDAEQSQVLASCHTDRTVMDLFAKVIDPSIEAARQKLVGMNLSAMAYEAAQLQGAIQFADELRERMKEARLGR